VSGGDIDLTGRWAGIFNYPDLSPPNSFDAELRDTGGLLSGLTTEQDDNPSRRAGTLHAVLEGRHHDNVVWFTKQYDDFEIMPNLVIYSGTVHPGGDEIEGRWEIPGIWSGTFLMVRSVKEQAEAERNAAVTIDL
jgi:hypothetical protein